MAWKRSADEAWQIAKDCSCRAAVMGQTKSKSFPNGVEGCKERFRGNKNSSGRCKEALNGLGWKR